MKQASKIALQDVESLREVILQGKLGIAPHLLPITGASSIYQTTQFPQSRTKYHNYYLLLRCESYFGACAHTAEQLEASIAGQLSGYELQDALCDERLVVRIAAMDAYLGVNMPHARYCQQIHQINEGTPLQKAVQRDELIANLAQIQCGNKVALIGVVHPLVAAIKERGGECLLCDLQLSETQWGDAIERDMEKVLEQADQVICTGMTLSNGTFDRVLEMVRQRNIPLTVYAQTGSAVVAQFLGQGVTSLVAEPFPFTQFSGGETTVYCYTAAFMNT